ncbi:hypothetical protein D3C77_607220 [compost metagenome]
MTADARCESGQANAHSQAGVGDRQIVGDVHRNHALAQLLRHQARPARRGVGEHQSELFAAITGRQVTGAGTGATNGFGDLAQRLVAGQMSEGIVECLKVVNIDHQQR